MEAQKQRSYTNIGLEWDLKYCSHLQSSQEYGEQKSSIESFGTCY